jgi:mannose-6-phosphate isomerase
MRGYLDGGYGELSENPGEAWLLFDDGHRASAIANGPLEQAALADLVRTRSDELVGRQHSPKMPFPLAVRLIDTASDQPLQVHPDVDSLAEPNGRTNAKFWYSLASEAGARIIDGIAQQVTNQQILLNLDKPGFDRLLQRYPARKGDSFLVPPGFVHSIGAGNLVLEIQQRYIEPLVLQTGDRASPDQGLDKQAALSAINREARTNLRISREAGTATHTRRIMLTPNCPYFQIEEIRLEDHIFLRATSDSFNLVIVTRGKVTVRWKDTGLKLGPGMLCCIPACCGDYKLETIDGGSELLRVQL